MAVGMRVTGDIVATNEQSETMEWFADRLMDALVSKEGIIDPSIGGALAEGILEVVFSIEVGSAEEGWSKGPALLFKAVQEAGMQPLHEWTDVPGVRNYGRVDPHAVLQRLVSHDQLLRSVRAELLPA